MATNKTKPLPAAQQGKPATTQAPAVRTTGVKANTRTKTAERQAFHMEAPEGVDMDVLADKIAARLRGAEIASNTAQGQGVGQISGASQSSVTSANVLTGDVVLTAQRLTGPILQHSTDPVVKASPIDGAMSNLQLNLNDLESNISTLINAIDPILLSDYDNEKSDEVGMSLASISPMHSRILGLTAQVKMLTECVKNTTGRVQL